MVNRSGHWSVRRIIPLEPVDPETVDVVLSHRPTAGAFRPPVVLAPVSCHFFTTPVAAFGGVSIPMLSVTRGTVIFPRMQRSRGEVRVVDLVARFAFLLALMTLLGWYFPG